MEKGHFTKKKGLKREGGTERGRGEGDGGRLSLTRNQKKIKRREEGTKNVCKQLQETRAHVWQKEGNNKNRSLDS
jgi:hypothetical protein